MKSGLLVLLICFLGIGTGIHGLTPSETDALLEIFQNYPDLPYISRLSYQGYGPRWTGDFSNCVAGTASWAYQGIHCDANGNVDAIVFTGAWGSPILNVTFNQISGLTFLRNYTSWHLGGDVLGTAILTSIPLEMFETTATRIPIDFILNRTSLTHLSLVHELYYSTSSLSVLVNLEYLKVSYYLDLRTITALTMLRTLIVGGNANVDPASLGSLAAFPRLTDLSIRLVISDASLVFYSTTVLRFTLYSSLGPGITVCNVYFDSLFNLQSLIWIDGFVPSTVMAWPPQLRQLEATIRASSLPSFPATLESVILSESQLLQFPALNQISALRRVSISGKLRNMIETSDWTKLSEVSSISLVIFEHTPEIALHEAICAMTGLTSLKISGPDISQLSVPDCLRSSNLVSVQFGGLSNATSLLNFPLGLESFATHMSNFTEVIPWDDFASRYSHLKEISFYSYFSLQDEFPARELMKLSILKSLVFVTPKQSFGGSLPETWFQSLPNLKEFTIMVLNMTGTFPWYGLENLERLLVLGSQFDSWPSLVGSAPLLKEVRFTDSAISEIPDDASFSTMTSLEYLYLSNNPNLAGTQLPQFWANHPNIQEVVFKGCFMTGTLPFISSLSLSVLDLSKNRISGFLPQLQNTDLSFISLALNQLSGTIPADWGQQLTLNGQLNLAANCFYGSIPSPFLSRGSRYTYVNVSNNFFEGPLPQVGTFFGDFNNFNACSGIHSFSTCTLMGNDVCACEGLVNTTCSTDRCPFRGTSRAVPTRPYCILPPVPANSCPGYVEGFICLEGQWVFNQTLSTPTLSLPAGLGVVAINGSLNVTGTLIFSGSGTSIIVNGCSKISQIEIVLESTPTDGSSKTPHVLIVQNDGCSNSLAEIPVKVTTPKSCKRTIGRTDSSTRSTLSVLFVVDSSRCNTKWIILGSVLGGCLVLTAIVLGVLSAKNYKLRKGL